VAKRENPVRELLVRQRCEYYVKREVRPYARLKRLNFPIRSRAPTARIPAILLTLGSCQMKPIHAVLFSLTPFLLLADVSSAQEAKVPAKGSSWMQWRGPDGTGTAPGTPPTEWSEDKNIKWKVDLPGVGNSTPIVWKGRIYLTTAITTDKDGPRPAAGQREQERRRRQGGRRRGRRGRSRGPAKVHKFVVMALDKGTGDVIWTKQVKEVAPREAGRPSGSLASNSPVTDGEHLYAYFGSRGLYCMDFAGNIKWSKQLGEMRTRGGFGEGSSPAVHGNTLVVTWDHEGDSFIVAFDKRTGDELWRKDRDEPTSWATPVVATVNGKPQVITSATNRTRAYDLANGDLVWSLAGMTANCIPTPIHRDGTVWLMSGYRGASLQAVDLANAKGEIDGSKSVLWNHGRDTSYVPSALLYGHNIYFLAGNNGVLSCLDAKTGKVHYARQRVRGLRTIYSSPVGAGGHVYLTSREGKTTVIENGPTYKEVASNQLDDVFDATMVIVDNEIFLRGRENLYCIADS